MEGCKAKLFSTDLSNGKVMQPPMIEVKNVNPANSHSHYRKWMLGLRGIATTVSSAVLRALQEHNLWRQTTSVNKIHHNKRRKFKFMVHVFISLWRLFHFGSRHCLHQWQLNSDSINSIHQSGDSFHKFTGSLHPLGISQIHNFTDELTLSWVMGQFTVIYFSNSLWAAIYFSNSLLCHNFEQQFT